LHALVSKSKDFLGKRSLSRMDTASPDRKQLVGLLASDPGVVLPEGAQIVGRRSGVEITVSVGHVTSSYMSPTLERSIALGLVRRGRERIGEEVLVAVRNGRGVPATIATPVFYDPEGARQRVE
jgi:sarcosine oxidase subunit alpha